MLGEQFAIMQNSDAVSGMFNLQNISLLAEIVDHDVTMIGGKVMDENGKFVEVTKERLENFDKDPNKREVNFFNQLHVGYNGILELLRDMSRAGVINTPELKMREMLCGYLKSYLSKLESKDISSTLETAKNGLIFQKKQQLQIS